MEAIIPANKTTEPIKVYYSKLMLWKDNPKITTFLNWLRSNGAIFDMIDLASFDGGLMGIAAKRDIGQYKVRIYHMLLLKGVLVHPKYMHNISNTCPQHWRGKRRDIGEPPFVSQASRFRPTESRNIPASRISQRTREVFLVALPRCDEWVRSGLFLDWARTCNVGGLWAQKRGRDLQRRGYDWMGPDIKDPASLPTPVQWGNQIKLYANVQFCLYALLRLDAPLHHDGSTRWLPQPLTMWHSVWDILKKASHGQDNGW